MTRTGNPVVVLGAGIAGLSAARVLAGAGEEVLVLEREREVGGLCRTVRVGGFAFDFTGHLLHLRKGESEDLLLSLCGEGLESHQRRASIRMAGTFAPYPIQAHFGRLPEPLARRCLEGFLAAAEKGAPDGASFVSWARTQFGEGLADLFMLPYNRKLFVHPLEEMEPSWTSWSVPRPTPEEIRRAYSGETLSFGYNASFFYPREGGIDLLPRALAGGLEGRIRLGAEAREVDPARRTVRLAGGEWVLFRDLISTIPLPRLLQLTRGLSPEAKKAAGSLRASAVSCLLLGLDGPVTRDEHWIYFPEAEAPFYRAGFPGNFSASVVPPGGASLYVETAYAPGHPPDLPALEESSLAALRRMGIIPGGSRVVEKAVLDIPCAYVFYDRHRLAALPGLLKELAGAGIRSIGRYGAWEYSAMQDAVEEGMAAARELLA